jgi:hypothetical protein
MTALKEAGVENVGLMTDSVDKKKISGVVAS